MLANFYFYLAMFFIVSFNFGKVSNVDELKEKTTIFLSLDSLYIYWRLPRCWLGCTTYTISITTVCVFTFGANQAYYHRFVMGTSREDDFRRAVSRVFVFVWQACITCICAYFVYNRLQMCVHGFVFLFDWFQTFDTCIVFVLHGRRASGVFVFILVWFIKFVTCFCLFSADFRPVWRVVVFVCIQLISDVFWVFLYV